MARIDPLEPILTETFQLEKLTVRALAHLDPAIGLTVRDSAELEARRDVALDRMVFSLQAEVLAEKLVDKTIRREHLFQHTVTYPRTWWQHFKQDVLTKTWLTRWFVNWRPVRLTHVRKREWAVLEANFKQYAKFPAADILTPEKIHRGIVVAQEMLTSDFGVRG